MNSYIDNLVSRTLDLAPVARPRLASVFESSGAVGGSAGQVPEQGESSRTQARPAESPRLLTQDVHTTVQVVQAQPEKKEVVSPSGVRSDVNTSIPTQRRETMPVLPAAETPATVRDQSQIVDTPQARITGHNLATAEKAIEMRSEPKHEKPPIASDGVANERDRLWRKLEPRVRQVVRDELPPLQAPHKDAGHDLTTIQPPAVSVGPPPKSESVAPVLPIKAVVTNTPVAMAAPAPEITVTIGRIDVRAVVSSSGQSIRRDSPRPTSPTSLEQYLKKRSEGRG